ncbi:MAG: hypothetical protein ACFFFG_01460 [Candidatus Thorarchaeota archaeon]
MEKTDTNEALFQLKIDYLQFMVQLLDWHDPNITLIIYALLMERKKITQKELMDLTGLSRSTISETLSLLINDPRGIPVLKTRKRGDSRNYYYVPLKFPEYIKRMFGGALKTIAFNLDFVPALLRRCQALGPQNEEVNHTKDFMVFFYKYNYYIQVVMGPYEACLEGYFENPEYPPSLKEFISESDLTKDVTRKLQHGKIPIPEDDNLDQIKRDFMEEMLKLGQGSGTGTNKDLAYTFFMLFMDKDPITQEEIQRVTGSRRAAISEALTLLDRQKFVTIVKKPNDRKKYYTPSSSLQSFISTRIQLSRHKINQIKLIMNSRFIPELEQISIDPDEKKFMRQFFEDTAYYFGILGNYMSDVFNFVMAQL